MSFLTLTDLDILLMLNDGHYLLCIMLTDGETAHGSLSCLLSQGLIRTFGTNCFPPLSEERKIHKCDYFYTHYANINLDIALTDAF